MKTDMQFNAERMWRLCLKCVWILDIPTITNWQFILNNPDLKYNLAVAQLLLGTAAQESNFEWERQRSPTWDGQIGGFSKWQLEINSIQATMEMLNRDSIKATKVTQFLFADPHANKNWLSLPLQTILWMLRLNDNDYLGIMFAREHYRRSSRLVSQVVPYDLEGQARYWKKYYNTEAGKGTVEQYLINWMTYCKKATEEI